MRALPATLVPLFTDDRALELGLNVALVMRLIALPAERQPTSRLGWLALIERWAQAFPVLAAQP